MTPGRRFNSQSLRNVAVLESVQLLFFLISKEKMVNVKLGGEMGMM